MSLRLSNGIAEATDADRRTVPADSVVEPNLRKGAILVGVAALMLCIRAEQKLGFSPCVPIKSAVTVL